jgi:hypothetical protein
MSTNSYQTFEECLSPDGKTFTLSRVGPIMAAAWLQRLLDERPYVVELILNHVEFGEQDLQVLTILSRLASTRNWKCWKFTDCPNLADNRNFHLGVWNRLA